jgi:mRNA interferase RelE/StbE
VTYAVRFTHRAEKDLARLDRDTQKRVTSRAALLGKTPYDPRVSGALTQQGRLRKSRIGGWRLIFAVDEESKVVTVVTIERRGQVYKRL